MRDAIISVLSECFSDECELAGPTEVEDLTEDVLSGRDAPHVAAPKVGARMEVATVISLLFSAASFVKTCIDLYNMLCKKAGSPVSATELKLVVLRDRETTPLPPDKVDAIIAVVTAVAQQQRQAG